MIDYQQQGIRIPMSVGLAKEDFDKGGEPCKIIDCIMNPEIAKAAKENYSKKSGTHEA